MPKLFYPFDPPAFWRRISLITMLGGVSVLIGPMFMLENLDAWREIGRRLLILPMLLLFIWDIALPLFVRQRIEDGLRIDENGLARIIGGREEFWSWGDVSDFRLHSGWHPVSLFIGRSITFRGISPARRSWLVGLLNRVIFAGRNIAIGDNYLVVSEEFADRLNQYRDMATGVMPKPVGRPSVRTPEPALFTARDTLDPGKRSRAVLILLGTTLASAAVMLGIILWSDDVLPSSVNEFLHSERIMAMLVPAFLILAQSLSQHFWQSSPASNLVLAAAGGLFRSKGLNRTHWRWDEIADIAVKAAAPADKKHGPGETVSFMAFHDGTKPGRAVIDDDADALVTAIDDIYDAPPAEIARRLEEWAAWGRAHGGPVTQDTVVEPSAAGRPGPAIRKVRWQMTRPSGALRTAAMLAFWGALAGSMAVMLLVHQIGRDDTIDPRLLLAAPVAGLVLLFGGITMLALSMRPGSNYLEVDATGLVYRRIGWRNTYGWHELASFELYSTPLRWSNVRRSIILFAAPRDDRISRYTRWAYSIGGIQPRIVIEDVYDVAVSEILAVLETHRRQGGRVSRRPAA